MNLKNNKLYEDVIFILGISLFSLLTFSILRTLLLIRNSELLEGIPLLDIVTLDFYHEFHNRLNSIAFQYLKEDPATVSSMIWNGFPVVRYLLLWLLITAIYAYSIRKIAGATSFGLQSAHFVTCIIITILIIIFIIIGARGGTVRSGPPLRWGDAFQSSHLFANHLALNDSYTFIKALKNVSNEVKEKFTTEHDQGAHQLYRNGSTCSI